MDIPESSNIVVDKNDLSKLKEPNNLLLGDWGISDEVATLYSETTIETETVETETKRVAKKKKNKKNKTNKKPKETTTKEIVEQSESKWVYLGEFKITFYCPCSKCCGAYANGITATGTTAQPYKTIAVDPNIISYFSNVKIDGLKGYEFVAEDTGGAIKGNRIDVFVSDHQTALNYGVMYTSVYKKGD